jgi:hypothetical protein
MDILSPKPTQTNPNEDLYEVNLILLITNEISFAVEHNQNEQKGKNSFIDLDFTVDTESMILQSFVLSI